MDIEERQSIEEWREESDEWF